MRGERGAPRWDDDNGSVYVDAGKARGNRAFRWTSRQRDRTAARTLRVETPSAQQSENKSKFLHGCTDIIPEGGFLAPLAVHVAVIAPGEALFADEQVSVVPPTLMFKNATKGELTVIELSPCVQLIAKAFAFTVVIEGPVQDVQKLGDGFASKTGLASIPAVLVVSTATKSSSPLLPDVPLPVIEQDVEFDVVV